MIEIVTLLAVALVLAALLVRAVRRAGRVIDRMPVDPAPQRPAGDEDDPDSSMRTARSRSSDGEH